MKARIGHPYRPGNPGRNAHARRYLRPGPGPHVIADYAFREYGASPAELQAFDKVVEQRYRKMKRSGKLIRKTPHQLRKMIEETARH